MSDQAQIVLAVLAIAVGLFATGRVRVDIVALLIPLALMLGDVLPASDALAGFSDSAVLMIAGLFVVGEGLVATGVALSIGLWLTRAGGGDEGRLMALLMATAAGIGAFMSSVGVVAIFIPIVLGIVQRTGFRRERLLMPLAFGALISGMLTLVGTAPNLVVNAELQSHGLRPFEFFEITPFGAAALVVAIVYMLFASRRLAGAADGKRESSRQGRTIRDLVEIFAVQGEVSRLRVRQGSPMAGQTIAKMAVRSRYRVTLLGVEREERFAQSLVPALADSELHEGDILYALAVADDVERLAEAEGLEKLPIDERHLARARQELGVAEVLLSPDSAMIGKTPRDAQFRSRYGLTVIGLRRKSVPVQGSLADEVLAFGDTLLVVGSWKTIGSLGRDGTDFVVLTLPTEMADVAPARSRAPVAIAILLAMTITMTLGLVPNVAAVVLAALGMVAAGCVAMDRGYRSINWPTVVLVGGMLPLAAALEKTGLTAGIVTWTADVLGGAGPLAMIALLFLITSGVGLFISNTATAVLMAPVAIGVAKALAVSPHAFAMTVAVASSAAFVTPVSSPVNTLVLGPGNYRFMDFVRTGLPLLLLTMISTVLLVALLYPL